MKNTKFKRWVVVAFLLGALAGLFFLCARAGYGQTNLASINLTGFVVVPGSGAAPVYLSLAKDYGSLSGCELTTPSNSANAWWWIASTSSNGPWTSVVNTGETAVVNGSNECAVALSSVVGRSVSGAVSCYVDGAGGDSNSIALAGFTFQNNGGAQVLGSGYSRSYDGTNVNACVTITPTNSDAVWYWTTAASTNGPWTTVGSTGDTYCTFCTGNGPMMFCVSLPTTNSNQQVQLQWR